MRTRGRDKENGDHKVIVAYTVKELLGNLEDKLDAVLKKLETKAEAVDMEKLMSTVEDLDKRKAALAVLESIQSRVAELEGKQDVNEAVNKNTADIEKSNKRWRWALASLVVTSTISIATLIVELLRR